MLYIVQLLVRATDLLEHVGDDTVLVKGINTVRKSWENCDFLHGSCMLQM